MLRAYFDERINVVNQLDNKEKQILFVIETKLNSTTTQKKSANSHSLFVINE